MCDTSIPILGKSSDKIVLEWSLEKHETVNMSTCTCLNCPIIVQLISCHHSSASVSHWVLVFVTTETFQQKRLILTTSQFNLVNKVKQFWGTHVLAHMILLQEFVVFVFDGFQFSLTSLLNLQCGILWNSPIVTSRCWVHTSHHSSHKWE